MVKKLNDYVAHYKNQLENGDTQIAYEQLVKYVMALKAHCGKAFSDNYSCGSVSPGYMDFTYFPFFDEFLRSEKLRFGIVLNHRKIRFELWLMGQNSKVQKEYWNLLKSSIWNETQRTMPKYSVLEILLIEEPDFNNLDELTAEIEEKASFLSKEIMDHIKNLRK